MLIDTTDSRQLREFEILKEQLIREKLQKGEYVASDIALVRVTSYLPINGFIPAISNVPFVERMNDISHSAIDQVLEEQGLNWNERKDLVKSLTPLSTQYRSSVHFCLNGVVSSHMQGNFDGNPFVIIEPFKSHENDENILAVRGEDTYFKDGVKLSSEALILVDEKYAQKCLNLNIDSKQIVFYKGNQKQAVDIALTKIGIVPEIIGKDYILDSPTSSMIEGFISKKEYPRDKHCYSENYAKDDEKTIILWQKYAESFYTYLYNSIYENIVDKGEEIGYLTKASCFDTKAINILVNIIKTIGIENYETIINNYNKSIIEQIELGQYPNNNDILMGASLNITSNKTL